MDQTHDGVAIVVPVNDKLAPTDTAHKETDGNGWQARGVLGKKDLCEEEGDYTVVDQQKSTTYMTEPNSFYRPFSLVSPPYQNCRKKINKMNQPGESKIIRR